MKNGHIPRATIQRLAVYLQELEYLQRDGLEVISSEPLARACDVHASQIRKDLTYFGEFGVRGVGYSVSGLIDSLTKVLGIDRQWNCGLVGVGNLGKALLSHREFLERRFSVVAIFDSDPFRIGQTVMGLEVMDNNRIKEVVAGLGIRIGIITCPPERAQRAANHLIEAGIKGLLNYSPARISVPGDVVVEYLNFLHHFYSVAFHLSNRNR
ncbi:MAG: redox-sensing transcriptional repressor Rex [Desulfovibrio sp.]|jgi:redox-sensing transcriptional repressor|nr:redox-sensing transcriptional repressor Rex [Desulfovibrio sp.]